MTRDDAALLFSLGIAVAMSLVGPSVAGGHRAEAAARLLREASAAASWDGFQLTLVCVQDERDCAQSR